MDQTQERTLVILRGLPGAGKSEVARFLTRLAGAEPRPANYFNMDQIRIEQFGGVYDPRDNEAVVDLLRKQLTAAMEAGAPWLILDNTHSRLWEYAWAIKKAERYGYRVHVLEVQTDIYTCAARQTHGVPTEKIFDMADRWERPVDMQCDDQRLRQLELRLAKFGTSGSRS